MWLTMEKGSPSLCLCISSSPLPPFFPSLSPLLVQVPKAAFRLALLGSHGQLRTNHCSERICPYRLGLDTDYPTHPPPHPTPWVRQVGDCGEQPGGTVGSGGGMFPSRKGCWWSKTTHPAFLERYGPGIMSLQVFNMPVPSLP